MTTPAPDAAKTGASIVGVGAAACAACCAVPLFGIVTAFIAGASAVTLAASGILLAAVVAAAGAGFVAWRRRRTARTSCGTEAPVSVEFTTRSGR